MNALVRLANTVRAVARSARAGLRDQTASVALMFAVSVLPIILVIGLAVDFGFVTQSQAQLNSAADAAALAAAKTAADAFTAGQQNYIALGQTAGSQWFSSQSTTIMNTSQQAVTVTVIQSGSSFASTLTYQATVSTYFATLVGYSTVPLAGTSSATITTNAYAAVAFLLDNSSSMLIAATQAGVDKMNSITPVGGTTPNKPSGLSQQSVPNGLGGLQCAFACHWDANGNDYYGLASNNHIQLRFDVLQSAVASAITQMINQERIPSQFSVGIYTFGNTLTKIYPANANQTTSTDLTDGIAAAQAMRSPVVPDEANTNFPAIMASLANLSTAAGDGSSPATPKKALIIVTDGLADYGSRSAPTSKGPINPADCTAMKALGYNIYVLYTTYITTPSNLVLPFDNIDLLPYIKGTSTPAMATSLQSCASSPANYAEASDPAAITQAMNQLLRAALLSGGRFTR